MKMISVPSCVLIAMMGLQDCFASKPGAFFDVTTYSNTITIKTTIPKHTYKAAGIKLNSQYYSLTGADCSTDASGYCLFSVSDKKPKTLTVSGDGLGQPLNITLCLDGKGPLSCQSYDNLSVLGIATYAYVGSAGGYPAVTLGEIDPGTGLFLSESDPGGDSTLNGVKSYGVVINAAGTIAYITSGEGSTPSSTLSQVFQCTINPDNQTFNSCLATTITSPSGYQAYYGSIALNAANTLAYIVDYYDGSNGRVLACPIIAGVISGDCTDTGATDITSYAAAITLNEANDTAYIANYSPGSVTICSVDGTVFSNCIKKTGFDSTTFGSIAGVALNITEDTLYIADYGYDNIYGCSTTTDTSSSFNSCFLAASIPSFSPWGITLNPANSLAYITDLAYGILDVCPFLPGGTISTTCTSYTGVFGAPTAVALGF